MAAFLVMSDGTQVAVEDGLVLGRVKGCDVIVKDNKASRRHARLISKGGVVEIEDLDSSNGTKLNGKAITRRMLRDGDEILIGKTKIGFREGAAAPAAPADDFAGGEDLFADDDPIEFADEAPQAAPPVAAPPVQPVAPEPVRPEPVPFEPAVEPSAEPSPRPPAGPPEVFVPEVSVRETKEPDAPPAAPDEEVLEFADDEIVKVKRALPGREKKAKPAPTGGREGGVLQYSKVGDKGVIRHDFSQMSGLQRLVLVVIALAVAGGLFYLAMTLTRGS